MFIVELTIPKLSAQGCAPESKNRPPLTSASSTHTQYNLSLETYAACVRKTLNYWLIALPRERLEFCIKVGIFGLNRKYILPKVSVGDQIVCYATKDRKIIATGDITVEYYIDDEPVFNNKAIFPTGDVYVDRIRFHAKHLNPEVDLIQVIDRMSFIKSLANWQIHFRSAIVQISKQDWELINSLAKAPA